MRPRGVLMPGGGVCTVWKDTDQEFSRTRRRRERIWTRLAAPKCWPVLRKYALRRDGSPIGRSIARKGGPVIQRPPGARRRIGGYSSPAERSVLEGLPGGRRPQHQGHAALGVCVVRFTTG